MFKYLIWILPFFVLPIMIEPYCCFECCFYISQIPSIPPSFLGMYSLFTSALGCNILCMFSSLCVFVSIFFSSKIFQLMTQKLYRTSGTARLLIASILFLPLSLVLRINLTLPLYSFLSYLSFCYAGYHHFHLHPGR